MQYIKHGKGKDGNFKVLVINKAGEKVKYNITEEVNQKLTDSKIKENEEFFNDISTPNKGVDKSTNPITITAITFPEKSPIKKDCSNEVVKESTSSPVKQSSEKEEIVKKLLSLKDEIDDIIELIR